MTNLPSTPSGVTSSPVTGQRGPLGGYWECQWCGHEFPPSLRNRKYCSVRCQNRAYNHDHPVARQRPLDFSGRAAPAIGTPAHAEQRAALDRRESKKGRLLALLRRGPAKTFDMMLAGGSGFRSRVQELREEGHRISTEEHADFAIYTLEATP